MSQDDREAAAYEAARALRHIAGMAHVGKAWKEMAEKAVIRVYKAFGEEPNPVTSAGGNYANVDGSTS